MTLFGIGVPDSIIKVDRTSTLIYPHIGWKPMFPALHVGRKDYYDLLESVEIVLHPDQKLRKLVSGHEILSWLKATDSFSLTGGFCLTLHDAEQVEEKGVDFFRQNFGGKKLCYWGSAGILNGRQGVPYQCYRGGLVTDWRWLDDNFSLFEPGLRFKA